MKRITELLKKMNDSCQYKDYSHSIDIYSDGSGYILNSKGGYICKFDSYQEMCQELDEIEAELNDKDKPQEWTL